MFVVHSTNVVPSGIYRVPQIKEKLISTGSAVVVAVDFMFVDAMSSPQIGVQIGDIHNNDTGGKVDHPQADLSNSSSTIPGSGYP